MLSLQMKSGDYVTIGNDIVVQVFRDSGPQFRLSIKAPREVPIVRGAVRERGGEERPEGLQKRGPKKSPSDQIHSARQLEKLAKRREAQQKEFDALAEMERILGSMERNGNDVKALRIQFDRIMQAKETVSTGAQAG